MNQATWTANNFDWLFDGWCQSSDPMTFEQWCDDAYMHHVCGS